MGNRNYGPITDKHVTEGSNNQFKYACCEMQGWRDSMVRIDKIYNILYFKYTIILILSIIITYFLLKLNFK